MREEDIVRIGRKGMNDEEGFMFSAAMHRSSLASFQRAQNTAPTRSLLHSPPRSSRVRDARAQSTSCFAIAFCFSTPLQIADNFHVGA